MDTLDVILHTHYPCDHVFISKTKRIRDNIQYLFIFHQFFYFLILVLTNLVVIINIQTVLSSSLAIGPSVVLDWKGKYLEQNIKKKLSASPATSLKFFQRQTESLLARLLCPRQGKPVLEENILEMSSKKE